MFRLPLLLMAMLCLCAAAAPPATDGTQPTQGAEALSRDEARALIDVLNDPAKRARLTDLLRQAAQLPAAPVPATPVGTAPAAVATVPIPLAPNGLGEALIQRISLGLAELSRQIAAAGQSVSKLPALMAQLLALLHDDVQRGQLGSIGLRLGAAFALAMLTGFAVRQIVRRPLAMITEQKPPDPMPRADGESTAERQSRRLLSRLLLGVVRLALDLLPIGAFGAAAALLPGFLGIGDAEGLRFLGTVCEAFITIVSIILGARAVLTPEQPNLRLLPLSDEAARYLVRWIRRLAIVTVGGTALAQISLLAGLNPAAHDALEKLVLLTAHALLIVIVLQNRTRVAQALEVALAPVALPELSRHRLARTWHFFVIAVIVGLWMVRAAEFGDDYSNVLRFIAALIAVLAIWRVASLIILGRLDRLFGVGVAAGTARPGASARVTLYYPLLRGLVSFLVLTITSFALLQFWGAGVLSWFRGDALGGQALSAAVRVAISILIAIALWEIAVGIIDRHVARLARDQQLSQLARLRTVEPILRNALSILLVVLLGLTILSEIGVNTAPLLAGAGIVGVAIGFGSQKLVQDVITGLFLLLENTMRVGDWVTLAGLSGSVEELSLRTIKLRAGDGAVHIVPFSAVSTVTNTNRGIGNAEVKVMVPIDQDPERVFEALKGIAEAMSAEASWSAGMRGPLELWGVDKVEAGAITITGQIPCSDAGRWGVQREFNRRLHARFAELKIPFANPTHSLVLAGDAPPADDAAPVEAAAEDTAGPAATAPQQPAPA